jgi:hypothetical protein
MRLQVELTPNGEEMLLQVFIAHVGELIRAHYHALVLPHGRSHCTHALVVHNAGEGYTEGERRIVLDALLDDRGQQGE